MTQLAAVSAQQHSLQFEGDAFTAPAPSFASQECRRCPCACSRLRRQHSPRGAPGEQTFTGTYTLTGTCYQVVGGVCDTKSSSIPSNSSSSLRFSSSGVLGCFCRLTLPCAAGGSRCSQSDGNVWGCLMIP